MKTDFDRPPTLTSAVTDTVRRAILAGELHPGEPLREVELSHTLNVSRGTVREAVRELQDEGLVEVVPHRGAFVTRLSPQTVREIFTLRALLEPYAVRVTMEQGAYTAGDMAALDEIVGRLARAEEAADIQAVLRADADFHERICFRCGHGLILDTLKNLRSLNHLYLLSIKLYRSDRQADAFTHREILETVQNGTPAAGELIVRNHIQDAGALLLSRMDAVPWDDVNAGK